MTREDQLDRLYRTREVAELEGISTRTLYEYVKSGLFPPPDVPPARHGAPAKWYGSTLLRVRAERRQKTVTPAAA
jgi:predicted site-specific integrase-resolvase